MSLELSSVPPDRDGHRGRYYTVAEAARKLKVSHSTVWRWIEAGTLPAYRVGPKTIRIKEQDLKHVIAPVTPATKGKRAVATRGALASADPASGRALAAPRLTPLAAADVRRRLAALEAATKSRQAQLASRGGEPFSSSTEVVRQIREELDARS
jgi:excisionase family DNA binding protein